MNAQMANDLLKTKLEERCTNLTAAFRKVDKSSNGFITPADFSEVMTSFGIRVTRASLMAVVAKYDANGDGFVSYEEFCANMSGTTKPGLAAAPKIAAPLATSRAEEATRRILCAIHCTHTRHAHLHAHCVRTARAMHRPSAGSSSRRPSRSPTPSC